MLSRFALLAAIPAGLALQPASEKLDLTPRFAKGQAITITQSFQVDAALDEMSVMMDGQPVFGDGVAADFTFEGDIEMSETIDEVRGTDIAKMHVTFDAMDMVMTGEVDAMGEGESIDETVDVPLTGRTVMITVDEDGETEAVDVTEDVEPLEDDVLSGLSQKNHFEMLLPTEPVEEGEDFELGAGWKDLVRDGMASMDSSEMGEDEMAMVTAVVEALIDATEMEATGKTMGVEDGVASIEYEMVVTMTIDDLVGLVQSIAPPGEMDDIPPGIEAMLEVTAEMTGTGKFDMEVGQLTELEITGDFEVTMSGNADIQGTSASADVLFSGEFKMGAGAECGVS